MKKLFILFKDKYRFLTTVVIIFSLSLLITASNQGSLHKTIDTKKPHKMFWYEDSNLASGGTIVPDFTEMFTTRKDEWGKTRQAIDVYILRVPVIKRQKDIVTDEFLKNHFLPLLKEDGIKLALDGGIASCVLTDEMIEKELAVIRRIHDLGGNVSYFAIQSVLSKPRDTCDDPTTNQRVENIDQRINGVVMFTEKLKERFPAIKVGIIDALPAKELEYKSWYKKLKQKLAEKNLTLDFIHQDMPITKPHDEWVRKTLAAEQFVKNELNIRTGLITTSAIGGRDSDKAFHDNIIEGYKQYKAAGGSADDIILMSWFPYPDKSLPEYAVHEYPFTRTALDLAEIAEFQ